MKKALTSTLIIAFAAGTLFTVHAADVKKNGPKNRRAVELILAEVGGDHNPKKMKVTEIGTLETESTYYHVYSGEDRETQTYHVIIFDNTPKYLGYYETDFEPIEIDEGGVVLDTGEAEGSSKKVIPIPDRGPAANVRVDNNPIKFTKAPVKEEAAANIEALETKTYEYRDWKISMGERVITVSAIFVKYEDRKVFLKDSKSGNVRGFDPKVLSAEDIAYLKKQGIIK